MKKSRWRLALAALLFACWIGYLGFLSFTTTKPIVLMRPQFLTADLYVVAQLRANPASPENPDDTVTIKRLIWSDKPGDNKLTKIQVRNLHTLEEKHGWVGPGEYILALTRVKEGKASAESPDVFEVTAVPLTPGFHGDRTGHVYPANRATLGQLERLTKEYHAGQ